MARKQQGNVKKNRSLGNKGAIMSGDDAATSKVHRKVKKARISKQ